MSVLFGCEVKKEILAPILEMHRTSLRCQTRYIVRTETRNAPHRRQRVHALSNAATKDAYHHTKRPLQSFLHISTSNFLVSMSRPTITSALHASWQQRHGRTRQPQLIQYPPWTPIQRGITRRKPLGGLAIDENISQGINISPPPLMR